MFRATMFGLRYFLAQHFGGTRVVVDPSPSPWSRQARDAQVWTQL